MRLPLLTLAVVFGGMAIENVVSRRNERRLRAAGAREPHDDVIATMRVAYPAGFVAMGAEALLVDREGGNGWLAGGALIFVVAKAIKYWAIAALGPRWSFRVLVLDGATLVTHGPYRWMRHPNYVGVLGEILGVAVALRTPVAGAVALLTFTWLLRRRIAVEERMLYSASSRQQELP
jgi:methyltransferase